MSSILAFAVPLPIPSRTPSPRPFSSSKLRPIMLVPSTTSAPSSKSLHSFAQRKLASSDLTLTEVCLGTMTFGHQNTEQQAHALLDYAHCRGVVGIDTAEIYPVPPSKETCGLTERFVGSWIRKRGGAAFRDKLVILSKVAGGSTRDRGLAWVRGKGRRVDRSGIRDAVHGILDRFGTDYVDLLQIHWPDRYVPSFGAGAYDVERESGAVSFEEQVAAMDELIREGKIRNYGLSNETAWGVAQFDAVARARGYARPVSIQNSYSLIYRDFESHLAEACAPSNADLPLLAYSPLGGGALTGKYLADNVPRTARFAMYPNYMKRFQNSLVTEATIEYRRIAEEANLTLTQLSLAWCKSRWFVGSTIVGATSVDQLQEDLDSFAIKLDTATINAVNSVYTRYRDPSRTS